MERMDMHPRNEYLKVVIKESYLKASARKEKTQLLDEYPDVIGVIPDKQGSTSSGRYTGPFLNRGKGRRGRRYMTLRSKLPWLRYGRSSTIPVVRGSSSYWKQKYIG